MAIPTGYKGLDQLLGGGLENGCLYVLAGRPSMGKSALALAIGDNINYIGKKNVVFFSLEMDKEKIFDRLCYMNPFFDTNSIKGNEVRRGESRLIIDDTPRCSAEQIREKCQEYMTLCDPLSVVIIDYVQLMSGNGISESRQREVEEILRELKNLSRELDITIVILSQLSRKTENRDDHRPLLSDFRESSAFETEPDVVLFLYRDDYYNRDTEKKGIAEINMARNRNGGSGTCELFYISPMMRFVDLGFLEAIKGETV